MTNEIKELREDNKKMAKDMFMLLKEAKLYLDAFKEFMSETHYDKCIKAGNQKMDDFLKQGEDNL